MVHYAAFDVSDKETAIHVLDEHGKSVWKGKRPSEPEALAAALRPRAGARGPGGGSARAVAVPRAQGAWDAGGLPQRAARPGSDGAAVEQDGVSRPRACPA